MLKVLINAYACCPNMGSEQGMGWNWISNIAKTCEVFVVTESEYEHVNSRLAENYEQYGITKEQCDRMHFYFIPAGETEEESAKIRSMCWNQGTWAFYLKYAKWQKKALAVARNIIDEQEKVGSKIDIMHQLNMAGFREPGMLYKINDERKKQGKQRIPLVWGPMTGYGSIPFPFMLSGGLKFTAFYSLKNTLNLLQLILHPRVRKMVKYSDKLIAATPEMKNGLDAFYKADIEHINETGCVIKKDETSIVKTFSKDSFKVLWVGRFMYTKQLEIALSVMSKLTGLKNIEFHIVGKGFTDEETKTMRTKAVEYGAEGICHWHGQIPNVEVHKLMQESDIFFFTSIFEATSTVILEAIQNGLPIVCFDRCGFGPIVDEKIGIKIPCKCPQQAVKDFASAINYLYHHREVLPEMSANCKSKRMELSWDYKMTRLMDFYRKLV